MGVRGNSGKAVQLLGMDTNRIVKQLTAERDRLNEVIKLLSGIGAIGTSTNGTDKTASTGKRKKWRMSAEARKRIAEAQKARWAKQRTAKKKGAA